MMQLHFFEGAIPIRYFLNGNSANSVFDEVLGASANLFDWRSFELSDYLFNVKDLIYFFEVIIVIWAYYALFLKLSTLLIVNHGLSVIFAKSILWALNDGPS